MGRYLIGPALILALLTPAALADDAKKSEMEPKALDVLKQAAGLYKDAKSLHVEVSIVSDREDGDGKRQAKAEAVYDMEKPNRFALRTKIDGKEAGPDLVCDGKKLYTQAKSVKQYTEDDAVQSLTDVGGKLLPLGQGNVGLLFGNVLNDDPYEALMMGVTAAKYAGTEKVNGTEAHHLKFEQPGLNWELWVAVEGKPVVLKAVSHLEGDGGGKLNTVETYQNWKIDDAPAKDAFKFAPGPGAVKVDSIQRNG
jgi:hypothetical protein